MALKNSTASLSLSKGRRFFAPTQEGRGFDKLSQAGFVSPMLVGN